MTYSNDPILPLLVEEIRQRTSELKQLTPDQYTINNLGKIKCSPSVKNKRDKSLN